MSLYNSLFGINKQTSLILALLGLGVGSFGRLRDTFVKKDEGGSWSILVFTRNGGDNRTDYKDVFEALRAHPNYLRDYDDEYDSTYATIEFSVPKKRLEVIEHIHEMQGDRVMPSEAFKSLLTKLSDNKSQDDPEVQRALNVGRKIFGEIKEKMEKGSGGIIEV